MKETRSSCSLWIISLAFLLACASSNGIGNRETVNETKSGESQEGIASYYARSLHGRPTASGELYDESILTAAHRILEFGTRVKVTNLSNGQTVIVRINDRGPFAEGRIIDLSYAAASRIELLTNGIAPVRLEILP